MAEGVLHRELVTKLKRIVLNRRSGNWLILVDALNRLTSDGCPPQLANVRPDLYAREKTTGHLIIGEAKISDDIENEHTDSQLKIYFEHLREQSAGQLIFVVPFLDGGAAHRICRKVKKISNCMSVPFEIIGCMIGDSHIHQAWHG
jgi:hypothetical protein